MTILACSFPDCTWCTEDVDIAGAAALLTIHGLTHPRATTPTVVSTPVTQRGPKLERPRINHNVSCEDWNAFLRRWQTFKAGSDISANAAAAQLLECTSENLGDIVLRATPDFTSKPIDEAICLLKSLAVVPVALGVVRSELTSMLQDADEPFRTFAARVQGKAETCEFKTKYTGTCAECNTEYHGETYYIDECIRDVLLNGIADTDIRREALSVEDIHNRSVNNIISFVETRETARNANTPQGLSALSTYRRSNTNRTFTTANKQSYAPSAADKVRTVPCPDCGKSFHPFSEKSRGWNKKTHERCEDCWKRAWANRRQTGDHNSIQVSHDQFGQVSGIAADVLNTVNVNVTAIPTDVSVNVDTTNPRHRRRRHRRCHTRPAVAALSHHIFTKGGWRRARLADHPRVQLSLSPEHAPSRKTVVQGLADSGAQSDVWSLEEYLQAGYSHDDLRSVSLNLNAANKSAIRIDGAFFSRINGTSTRGTTISHNAMVYVSRDVKGFYLSYNTMVELGMIPRGFPTPGCALPDHETNLEHGTSDHWRTPSAALRAMEAGCTAPRDNGVTCNCPHRENVPPRPTELPFPCTPENNEKMKRYLLERYSSSTFNTCPHRPIPCMSGPPLEIHINDTAEPYVRHKPAPIPLHWQQRVYEDLLRDEALGVIERVPYGEPVTWCHRMVVTRKHDGSPRRTVDLSPLNKHCKRETHSSESPFHVARRVPAGTWKTVTDAWNGYHSVPLRESDQHLTTFITPFGRWRYKRALQGYVSSGDGFNRRFDAILTDFERKERVVDDTVHFDTNLEDHWWRTIDFLSTAGAAGVVLNPDKFQFAEREVDFAGFRISENKIDPLPKFFNAIRDFPTPTSITDIKSWFGLVNHVANYAQLRDIMAPFRPFLSPKHQFCWTPELDEAFTASKEAIIASIRKGVEIFDPKRKTCLRTDWSVHGVGYFLLQQHCQCKSGLPDCCPDGWQITLAGSRFLQGAEQRYAPIEGEALSIAWALEQTRYFTQGCDDLLVVTDHKPLVKIFGDRTLDEIRNTRLFRLKQRALPWYFDIFHLPGETNISADATSRHPSPAGELNLIEVGDQIEYALIASIHRNVDSELLISWQKLVDETRNDQEMKSLLDSIRRGFPEGDRHEPFMRNYWRYHDALYELDGVILYDDRVVIPPSLRPQVVNTLHAAHQGVSSMEVRARSIAFWPGMTADIDKIRSSCQDCIRNAPSQPRLPPASYTAPSTPFEKVVADYFQCAGQHYLVIADRLSGWVDIFKSPHGSPQAGAEGLMCCLRNCFARFGVPEELASDGGPEFISEATESFLSRWGIYHRGSSAYNPQSNGRAEVAVKSAKRLLRSNTGPSGSLNTDRFLRAMLQLRNSPDPDCNLSPAQVIFGRPLRDAFAFTNRLEKYSNPHIRPVWRDAWRDKECALRQRFHRTSETLSDNAHPLPPLAIGDRCYIQNQHGNHPKRWDKSGTVVESLGHDSYCVKVDGSGRISKRNRRFLRNFEPPAVVINYPAQQSREPHPPSAMPWDNGQTHQEQSALDREYTPNRDTENCLPPPTVNASPTTHDPPVEIVIDMPSNVPESLPPDSSITDHTSPEPDIMDTAALRPRRSIKAPPSYEPETGKWI